MAGRGGRGEPAGAAAARSPPHALGEALLFTTVCIVGLPVEVQVKDGSIYAGIFHTACVENEYGIVLKKARKIVKGKCDGNLGIGVPIDTLVVLSDDLVQVIAKGVILPTEGTVADFGAVAVNGSLQFDAVLSRSNQNGENTMLCCLNANDSDINAIGEPGGRTSSTKILESINEVETRNESSMVHEKIEEASHVPVISVSQRQVGECKPEGDVPCSNVCMASLEKAIVPETCSSYSSTGVCLPQVNSIDDTHMDISINIMSDETRCNTPVMTNAKVEASDGEITTSRGLSSSDVHTSSHSTSVVYDKTSSYPCLSEMSTFSASSADPTGNMRTKEFKLNPGAKTFSPSFANPRTVVPVVSTVANIGYAPNTYTVFPIATAQSAIEIGPSANGPSVQSKFLQHINVATGNTGPVSQFSHPITGQVGIRNQPLRFSGQYNPVQTGPAYLFPSSQMVTAGRRGQVMYVHPVSQDVIQGIPAFTQVPPHSLMTPYPANPPKLQGSATPPLQLCVNQPIFPGGQQLPTVPIQIPFSNPPPSFQAIQVFGSSNLFASKF